ncbi:putative class 3 lipase [Encephalitozoon intestinalis ATCC 50506]|uniref:sn-1-specific diacylglycerol lipase n=1 Tax=Encephalitozoon intestinalis (strain ATCC 50506) TaxID=876142 RepID=E0S6I2_ENCIT|nr:putative class 3 lipase [Encephalitozoon intestinalis ATCC 50506]ADM11317.1 putative class 3 lipase [Encephalitozoon intestinalis ATCC 50506]UTX45003.1 class 3 lipase [Encephalitozoon intestinalis]
MEVDIKIRKVEVPENTYDTLVLCYDGEEVIFKDRAVMTFKTFHHTVIGDSRILLMKNSFPWDLCMGFVLLNHCFFRNGDEKQEHTLDIYHGRYRDKASSYDFEPKEVIGKLHYTFGRKIYDERDMREEDEISGFVQKVFGFFFSNEKAGTILSIKKLVDYVNRGSHGCRLNILFGGLLVEKTIAEINARFTKNIDLVLEVSHEELPRVFDEANGRRSFSPSEGGIKEDKENEKRLFRLKLPTHCSLCEKDGRDESSICIPSILSSNGYLLCNLEMLRKIKRLFYFAMGSYANSWPSMFLRPQASVGESVSDERRAVLKLLGIENKDLLCMHLEPSEVVQHIIFHDRENERVVISFKGTTNSEETIQDINCEYAEFSNGFVHNGFKRLSTHFINNHINSVEKILGDIGSKKLLLLGHSLGGAISILVKIMVEEMGLLENVDVEAIVFSSPPVVSEEIASRFAKGITVIIYGNDIIPRMSYGSVLDLKFLCCSIGEKHGPMDSCGEMEKDMDLILTHLRRTNLYPKLYLPGELVHMKRIRCSLNKNENPMVTFKLVERRFFEQIILVKHAPKHHMVGHIASVIDHGISMLEKREYINSNWV